MAELHVLASGSKGNSYIIEHNNVAVVVDIGVNKSVFEDALNLISPKEELFLFITHEHNDHVKGIKSILKYNPKVFCSFGTACELEKKFDLDVSNFYILEKHKYYKIDGFEVIPFLTAHDGAETFGYHFNFAGRHITFSTDLGVVTDDIIDFLSDSHFAILESNYEDSLLKNGKYPGFLKKRIESIKGHLSNKQAINALSLLSNPKLEKVFLAHVSEENNRYEIVEKYVNFCNENFGFQTSYLRQKESVFNIKI